MFLSLTLSVSPASPAAVEPNSRSLLLSACMHTCCVKVRRTEVSPAARRARDTSRT